MNNVYFDVVTSISRQDKSYSHRIGRAWVHAGERGSFLTAKLMSVPLSPALTLFPPDDQEPQDAFSGRLDVCVRIDRGEDEDGEQRKPFWHRIGVAFYNAPVGDKRENFRLRLDSLPLSDTLYLFAPSDERAEDAAA
jgi:hypothetical protein